MSDTELTAWLTERVAHYLRVPADQVDADTPFTALGLDSVGLICIAAEIDRKVPGRGGADPMLAWEHPTITAMAAHLSA